MHPPRLLGTVRAAALAAALALAACSDGPATPEELFEEGCRVTVAGDHGAFWDLLTTEQRTDVEKRIDGMRETVRRNPGGLRQLVEKQWQVSEREFVSLPPRELWARAHAGLETVLAGARIVDRAVDPVNGTDVVLTIENPRGQRFRWVTRNEPGRGWRFQAQHAVKVEVDER